MGLSGAPGYGQDNREEPRFPKEKDKPTSELKLSSEDRERIRAVLAEAWKRPEVIAARDEVHSATENYKKALEKAVSEIDPDAEGLMKRLHNESKMEAMRHRLPPHPRGTGRGMGPKIPKEVVERIASSEPAFREMDFEERRRFLDIAEKTFLSGALDEAFEQLKSAATPEENGRARNQIREKLIREMGDRDSWAKEKIEAAPPPPFDGGRPPHPSRKDEKRKNID